MRDGAAIASALDGYRSGKGWKFRCPIHNDNTPSASIRDDGLVTCFAGCARAEVCARLDELGFVDDESKSTVSPEDIVANEAQRIAAARQMWTDALDDAPYIASYLKSRGVTLAVPPIMKRWRRGFITPLQLLDGTITAVHTKISYGKGLNWGAMYGGAVKLAPPLNGEIGLAESVFDALSATQITGVPAGLSAALRVLARLICRRTWSGSHYFQITMKRGAPPRRTQNKITAGGVLPPGYGHRRRT